MINNNKLILNFVSRIGIFAFLAIIGLLLSGFSALLITSIWGENTVTLRISTVIQNVFFFITPAFISSKPSPYTLLAVETEINASLSICLISLITSFICCFFKMMRRTLLSFCEYQPTD